MDTELWGFNCSLQHEINNWCNNKDTTVYCIKIPNAVVDPGFPIGSANLVERASTPNMLCFIKNCMSKWNNWDPWEWRRRLHSLDPQIQCAHIQCKTSRTISLIKLQCIYRLRLMLTMLRICLHEVLVFGLGVSKLSGYWNFWNRCLMMAATVYFGPIRLKLSIITQQSIIK